MGRGLAVWDGCEGMGSLHLVCLWWHWAGGGTQWMSRLGLGLLAIGGVDCSGINVFGMCFVAFSIKHYKLMKPTRNTKHTIYYSINLS